MSFLSFPTIDRDDRDETVVKVDYRTKTLQSMAVGYPSGLFAVGVRISKYCNNLEVMMEYDFIENI